MRKQRYLTDIEKKQTYFYVIECEHEGHRWALTGMEGMCSCYLWLLRIRMEELQKTSPDCKLSIAKYKRTKKVK